MLPSTAPSHVLILLFTCTIGVGSTGNNIENNDNFDGARNLIKVLNTSELYWVYYQTYSNSFSASINNKNFTIETTCIRYNMTGLSSVEYNFTRYQTTESITDADNFTGRFIYPNETDKKAPTSMNVYEAGASNPDEMWILLYTDPETHKCNVYEIRPADNKLTDEKRRCEMHIKDSQVRLRPTHGCDEVYKEKCSGKRYEPYKPQCTNKGNEENIIVYK
uniref:Lipocalin n=1 Tax=Rhipicephalus appendiculatus TaxID=34631 RepID=A0A131YHV5_RHIAP